MQVRLGVPILHNHDEPRPAVRQVVAGHALAALGAGSAGVGGRAVGSHLLLPPRAHARPLTSCRSPLLSVSKMMASARVVGWASTGSTMTSLELYTASTWPGASGVLRGAPAEGLEAARREGENEGECRAGPS